MRANSDLTVYNRYVDPVSRTEAWVKHHIRGVVWENRKAANVLRSGLLEADSVTVYIPMAANSSGYLGPAAWQQLSDKSASWTLQPGDLLAKGLLQDDLGPVTSVSDLKQAYDDVVSIRSVDRMDNGSRAMWHWEIGAS